MVTLDELSIIVPELLTNNPYTFGTACEEETDSWQLLSVMVPGLEAGALSTPANIPIDGVA
jgi:hypothetical protein